MRTLVSRTHYPVEVLGPGRRAGIWFQGCTIRCPGCISVDTWPADDRAAIDTEDLLRWLDSLPADEVDGVTISGGEPTEQPDALRALLAAIARWQDTRRAGLPPADVLVYTGREPDWLHTPEAAVLTGADAVVVGPYRLEEAGSSALRGSENQRLVTLTPLGRARYTEADALPRNAIQVEVVDGGIWMVGIPLPGDLAAVRAAAAERGIQWKGASWQNHPGGRA